MGQGGVARARAALGAVLGAVPGAVPGAAGGGARGGEGGGGGGNGRWGRCHALCKSDSRSSAVHEWRCEDLVAARQSDAWPALRSARVNVQALQGSRGCSEMKERYKSLKGWGGLAWLCAGHGSGLDHC